MLLPSLLNLCQRNPVEVSEEVERWILDKVGFEIQGLYSCQRDALREALDAFFTGETSTFIAALPTGSGKGLFAAAFLVGLWISQGLKSGDSILLLSPRIIINRQFYSGAFGNVISNLPQSDLKKFYGVSKGADNTKSEELRWFMEKRVNENSRLKIAIATPQLINSMKDTFYPPTCIILDEIHHTDWGPNIIESIKFLIMEARYVLALSATPTKEAMYGIKEIEAKPRVYRYGSAKAMFDGVLTASLRIKSTKMRVELRDHPDIPEYDKWTKYAIEERAETIANDTLHQLEEERALLNRWPKTLIIAANTKEADLISNQLTKALQTNPFQSTIPPVYLAHYKIKNPADVIDTFRNRSEGFLVTVNMADIGFDDRDLEALVIGRPIKNAISYVQIRGRVLRKTDSKGNLKSTRGYALLVDFTGASKHEENVEDAEGGTISGKGMFWDFPPKDENERINRVHGNVYLNPWEKIPLVPLRIEWGNDKEEIISNYILKKKLNYSEPKKIIIHGENYTDEIRQDLEKYLRNFTSTDQDNSVIYTIRPPPPPPPYVKEWAETLWGLDKFSARQGIAFERTPRLYNKAVSHSTKLMPTLSRIAEVARADWQQIGRPEEYKGMEDLIICVGKHLMDYPAIWEHLETLFERSREDYQSERYQSFRAYWNLEEESPVIQQKLQKELKDLIDKITSGKILKGRCGKCPKSR